MKRFISTALVALLLLDWPILSAYAEHAKTDREWRVGKLRQLRSEVPYRDVTENVRTFDSSKKDAANHAVRRSLSSESRLTFRFRSSDGLDMVRAKLSEFDSSATVRKLAGDSYELSVPKDSDLATEFLPEASEGKLPEKLPGWYEVVEPAPVETMSSTGFLVGERTGELWWQAYVRADITQEAIAALPEISIGVIDSGVDTSHPDLVGRVDVANGYDFVENDSDPQDANGHGTFVAGIIAGAVNGSGIYGIDSNAKIVPLRILDADGVGTTYDLADAISLAASKGIKVVNVSLGGYGDPATDPVCQAVSAAKAAGTVVIAAAGNSNADVSSVVPAGCPEAVAVGAVGKDGFKAPFSNYGTKIAVSAPGVEILSSWKGGGYETRGGTSASSAFVAGAVGAVFAKDSSTTPDAVVTALESESGGILDIVSLLLSDPASVTEIQPDALPPGTTLSGAANLGTGSLDGEFSSTWTIAGSGSSTWSGRVSPPTPTGAVSALTVGSDWLIGEWLLDGDTNDSGGGGYNAAATDVTYPALPGNPNLHYAAFNGTSSKLDLPTLPAFHSFTLSAWVYYPQAWHDGNIFRIAPGYDRANIDVYVRDGKINVATYDGGQVRSITEPSVLLPGNWYFLSVRSDAGNAVLEVDGHGVSERTSWVLHDIWYWSDYSSIGYGRAWNTGFVLGWLRSVRMYGRALSDAEVGEWRNGFASVFPLDNPSSDPIPPISRDWLIGEWLFDGNTADTSGNGNDGIPHNLQFVAGKFWNAADVPIGSYVEIGNSNALNFWSLRTDYTIWFWFKTAYSEAWLFSVESWNGWPPVTIGNDRHIFLAGGNVCQRVWNNEVICTVWTNYADGNWHHVTQKLWNGHGQYLYVDGALKSAWNLFVSTFDWATKAWIGYSHDWANWSGTYTNGQLDDLRIYDRPLSDTEIRSLYLNTTPDTSSTHPSPPLSGVDLSAYAGSTSSITRLNDAIRSGNFQTSPAEGDGSRHDVANAWDPVTLSTGEFAYSNIFLKAKEGPMPYEFSLTYRNQMPYDGPAGQKFDHNYNIFLVENADGSVNYYDGKLGIFNFSATETGFARNDGLRATLEKDAAGHYFIVFDGGARREFWPNLRLSKDSDKYGNSISFAYYSNDALSTVTDVLGRNVEYEYGSDTRLSKVTDWLNRAVELAYFPNGDLKTATLKSGTASKAVSFTYVGSTHDITTLVDAKGQTYVSNVYDSNWRVTSQTYGNGTINYSYELSGSRVASNTVTNAEGVITKYSYDSNGNVTERRVYDRTGGWSTAYRYEYYSNARLAKSVMPNGNGTTYLYDARGNVVEKRDKTDADASDSPDDLVTYAEYDPTYGIPVRSESPDEIETTAVLDSNGNVLSRTVTGILNPEGSKYSSTVSYEYDSQGKVIKTTDPMGRETAYSYLGGLTSSVTRGTGTGAVTETFAYGPDGNPVSLTDAEGKTKTFEYDAFGRPIKTASSESVETRFQYDANGNKTREEAYSSTGVLASRTDYAYDALDKLVTKTVKTGEDSSIFVHTAYDANGNVISERLGTAAEIRTAYDEMGRVKEKRVIADPADPSKDAVTSYSYDRNGNLLSVTDPLGNVVTNVFDGFDRKIRSTDPLGNITTYAYDEAGNAVETRTYSSAQILVSRTLFVHDGAGHVIKTVRKGDGSVPDAISTTRYAQDGNALETVDAMGNATAYAYDSLGRKTSVTDPLGNRAETSYDKRGLVSETRLVGSGSEHIVTTRYAYDSDGRKTAEKAVTSTGTFDIAYSYGALADPYSATDADGNRTDFAYDFAGRKVSETEYLADGAPVTTSYGYDGNGNLASVTDAEGRFTLYSYDALGQNVRVTYPDWTHKAFSYDKAGNRVGESLARGVSTSTAYDANGRPTYRAASGSWIPVPESETYAYDAVGRLVSATSSGSTLSFSYDFLGRISSETQNGKTVEYGYDANGSRLSVSASGYLAEYSRDALGRIVSASLDGTGILSRSYSGAFLASDSFWNGSRTDYLYDALGRLNSLSRPNVPSATRNYAYSPAGDVLSDGLRNYAYDPLSRLVSAGALPDSAHPAGAESFGYDKASNRTASELAGTSASYSGNLLDQYVSATSGSGTANYSYDADGNMSTDGKFLYSYDSKNRLVSAKDADGSSVASYSYDPLGRRTSKSTDEDVTEYLYSGENAITETFIPTGAGTPRGTSNLFGDSPDELLAYSSDVYSTTPEEASERLFCALRVAPYGQDFSRYGWNALVLRCAGLEDAAGVSERKTFAVLSDRLGSPVALVDASGSTVLEYSYSAFGEAYAKSWTGGWLPVKETGNLLNNARLFAGRERDAETGLYYNRARTYSPELGRFLQRDPAWQADQVNPYTYVGNDPLGFTDPSGMVGMGTAYAAGAGAALSVGLWYYFDEWSYDGRKFATDLVIGAAAGAATEAVVTSSMGVIWIMGSSAGISAMAWLASDAFRCPNGISKMTVRDESLRVGAYATVWGLAWWLGKVASSYFTRTAGNLPSAAGKELQASGQVVIKNELKFDKHAVDRMAKRGWTEEGVRDAVNWNYKFTMRATDKSTGNSATAYYISENQYVVVDDVTGRVVQVSDLADSRWKPDSTHY